MIAVNSTLTDLVNNQNQDTVNGKNPNDKAFTLTITLADAGGTYNGDAFPATATVTGINGVQVTNAVSYSYSGTTNANVTYGPTAAAPTEAGSYSVTVTVAAGGDLTSAISTAVGFSIGQATPTIAWANPSNIFYGTPLSSFFQLDATASWTVAGSPVTVAGTFTYTPPANTVLAAGSQTLSAHFAPQDTTDYAPADLSVPLTVQAVSPTFFRLSASQTIVYGTATINVSGTLAAFTAVPANQTVTITVGGASATATVGADGTFKTTITTSAIQAATTPYTIFYSYTDSSDSNFLPASDSSTTLTVNKATPTRSRSAPRAPRPLSDSPRH